MGGNYLQNLESQNIVALCDVDSGFAAKTFARYPKAKTYADYRVMLEKEKGIDGVVIGTPDHSHAQIALAALALGKARLLRQAADPHRGGRPRRGEGGGGCQGRHPDEHPVEHQGRTSPHRRVDRRRRDRAR
ncbi:MAG: Gfo/Idh/MocA family oxidoreductase [Verrucomicrobiales bacterium]